MKFLKKNLWTKIATVLILGSVWYTLSVQEKWRQTDAVITSDVRGYYAYLPAFFIHDDVKFNDMSVYVNPEVGSDVWIINDTTNHSRYIKYTCGMALLYSPFFLYAHATAESDGYAADGFSQPYRFALVAGSFFYLIVALFFLGKFLLLHFTDGVTALVLLILFLGTNAFHYVTASMTFSHGYSLAVISIFFYCAAKWIGKPSWSFTAGIGLSVGLMLLIRPIDVLFLSFPLLYKVSSLEAFKQRMLFFLEHKWKISVMILLTLLVFLPQILYNLHVFGGLFAYSYTGESFFFGHPHLRDVLISYRNGWLVYSPLMVFSLLGFIVLWRKKEGLGGLVTFTFIVYWYVLASWWCWWYMGFGNRAFINLYPLLSIPLGYLITFVFSKHWLVRLTFTLILLPLIALNLFQSYQFEKGFLHWGAMTKDAYWDAFGRTTSSQMYPTYLIFPDVNAAKEGKDIIYKPIRKTTWEEKHDFEHPESLHPELQNNIFHKKGHNSDQCVYVNCDEFALNYPIHCRYSPQKHATRLYVSLWVKCDEDVVLVTSADDVGLFYNSTGDVVKMENGWKQLELYAVLVQNEIFDTLNLYVWNPNETPYFADDLQIKWIEESFDMQTR